MPNPASASTSESPSHTLARSLALLEVFDRRRPALSVKELVTLTGIPRTTVYRLANDLIQHDLLSRDSEGLLRTTVRLWRLGVSGSTSLGLRDTALPYLSDLRAFVGQHVQLSILDGEDTLYLEQLPVPDAVKTLMSVAERVPARLTSSGILLAAYAPSEVRERIIEQPAARRWSPPDGSPLLHDPTPLEVRRLVSRAKTEGVCRVDRWLTPEATGLSVPVRGGSSRVLGAVSLIMANDTALVLRALPALRATAASLSRALGWEGHAAATARQWASIPPSTTSV